MAMAPLEADDDEEDEGATAEEAATATAVVAATATGGGEEDEAMERASKRAPSAPPLPLVGAPTMPKLDGTKGQKLVVKQFPRLPGIQTEDDRYWRSFKFPMMVKHPNSVVSVAFSPNDAHYLVATGARVRLRSAPMRDLVSVVSPYRCFPSDPSIFQPQQLVGANVRQEQREYPLRHVSP